MILKQHNVLEVLKSSGVLPKGEGPIVQVLDSIRRWEEQFLQVLRGLNLACSVYGKLLLNGVHSTLNKLRPSTKDQLSSLSSIPNSKVISVRQAKGE